MDKKHHFSRLGARLVGVSVLGLALAFAIFYLVDSVAVPWFLHSEQFAPLCQLRNKATVQAYQDYVTERGLTVQQATSDEDGQLNRISAGLYIIMVGNPPFDISSAAPTGTNRDDINYSLTWEYKTGVVATSVNPSVEILMELYQIQCADGVLYVSNTPAAVRYGGLGRITGLALALLGFCAVVIPSIIRLPRRIVELSRETGVLMAGDLEHPIHIKGRDELSELGEDIERLRRSVLARIAGERAAVAANSHLTSSLSHDLRTPLTKLTGYLDILNYQRYQTQSEHDEFLRLASEKAAQIKALTDQLFASAQVDAPMSGLEQPPEAVDGAALLGQLLTEQCDDLRREGFDVEPPVFFHDFSLYLSTADVVRIFDNLFSNLRKYADPAIPVHIQAEESQETVVLRIENRALPAPDRADSHGLGIPTVRELMARSGGTLEVRLGDGVYRSMLTFPKYRGTGKM